MSAFKNSTALEYATVILPIAPFTETAGTFVNTEGRVQSFNGVVKPLGDARPAWKVLRVLGNLLQMDGFDQDNIDAIRREIAPDLNAFVAGRLDNAMRGAELEMPTVGTGIERIGEAPIYAADALVRRAPSLQKTADAKNSRIAYLAPDVFAAAKLSEGDEVRISMGSGAARLIAKRDERLPAGCVRVAAAIAETVELGPMFGELAVEKVPAVASMPVAAE